MSRFAPTEECMVLYTYSGTVAGHLNTSDTLYKQRAVVTGIRIREGHLVNVEGALAV